MAGKVLHQDLSGLLEVRAIHAKAQKPSSQSVFLIGIVHLFCLNPLLADSLLVHQNRKVSECSQVVIIRCSRETCKGYFLICDRQAFQGSTMLFFILFDRMNEICYRISAAVIFQGIHQSLIGKENAVRCFADEFPSAVDQIDQVAKRYAVMLTDRERKIRIQRDCFLCHRLFPTFFRWDLLCTLHFGFPIFLGFF